MVPISFGLKARERDLLTVLLSCVQRVVRPVFTSLFKRRYLEWVVSVAMFLKKCLIKQENIQLSTKIALGYMFSPAISIQSQHLSVSLMS